MCGLVAEDLIINSIISFQINDECKLLMAAGTRTTCFGPVRSVLLWSRTRRQSSHRSIIQATQFSCGLIVLWGDVMKLFSAAVGSVNDRSQH